MCEGYYDGMPSLYHWVVKDTETGRLIDVHFDLIGTTIDSFTITNEMTINEYDIITSDKEKRKKQEKKKQKKEFQKLLKKFPGLLGS
jgi:superfamily I DNA and RNA helicase